MSTVREANKITRQGDKDGMHNNWYGHPHFAGW